MDLLLAWMMSCSQYHEAIDRLYANPFFQKPENYQQRQEIHEVFKTRTWPECLEIDT